MLLLAETPRVMSMRLKKKRIMAREKRYTAVGPVNTGQLGPPRSSSSHFSDEYIVWPWSSAAAVVLALACNWETKPSGGTGA